MNNARRTTSTAVGVIVAFAGFEHGLGELLQGPVAPDSPMIQSWPDAAFYRSLQGEPALTLIPNLAISGIITMALSVALLLWVLRFVDRRRSAVIIALMSIALLLVGGGFGPPLLGLILAIPTVKVSSELTWWRDRRNGPVNRLLAAAWGPLLVACMTAWVAALVGIAALDYFLEVESVGLTLTVLAAAFVLLPAIFLAAFARDARVGTHA